MQLCKSVLCIAYNPYFLCIIKSSDAISYAFRYSRVNIRAFVNSSPQMQTIQSVTSGFSRPYNTPLRCMLATKSDVIKYHKDGEQKEMIYLGLCDHTGFTKATLYDPSKVANLPNKTSVIINNFIVRPDKMLVLTKQTKIFKTKQMDVPDSLIEATINSVRPATPPPIPTSMIKTSPIKTLTSVAGEITQVSSNYNYFYCLHCKNNMSIKDAGYVRLKPVSCPSGHHLDGLSSYSKEH